MALLPLMTVADPKETAILRAVAQPVTTFDAELRRLIRDMFETMYDSLGIGLAANQVGVLKRVLVMDLKHGEEDQKASPRVYINPEITWRSEETASYDEGCLSIPGVYEDVVRPASVRFTYLDETGKPHEEEAKGLYAVCVQHEIDHLNGVLFIDHISRLKRERAINRVKRDVRAGLRRPGRRERPDSAEPSSAT